MQTLSFTYTNWKGETATRAVVPHNVWFGVSPFHGDRPQWFLKAWDAEKNAYRDFAMTKIRDIQ